MKTALVFFLILLAARPLAAQSSSGFTAPRFRPGPRGQVLEYLLHGQTATNFAPNVVLVTVFRMESFRDGTNVQFIAQAPECFLDANKHVARDAGRFELFTPTTNLWLQGDGFFFTETNRFLYLSNNVETRVLRPPLKSPLANAPRANAPPPNGVPTLKIFARRCQLDNQSNVVDYAGDVHVIDPQMDLRSDFLTVHFATNGAIENILARQNVVIDPANRGRATGATALYYITNGVEMMNLAGDATWNNGAEQARAAQFTYDSTHHFLTATGHVRVQWPNAVPTAAQRQSGAPPAIDASGLRKLFADFATLQWPPTNGPVERMNAEGNVIIVNQADQSRSTSDRAAYVRTNDAFELSGHSDWRNDKTEVWGDLLTAEITNKVYHSRGDARLKLKINSAARTNAPAPPSQWLDVTCANLDFQTNLAVFHDRVHAQVLQIDSLRDTLYCDLLHVTLVSNQVETAIARGRVRGQTAPGPTGIVKTISCETLTVHRSPATGLMKNIRAEDHVVLTDFGAGPKAPFNKLTADVATARFSPATNLVEQAVAEDHVTLEQTAPGQTVRATAQRALYTTAIDQVKLTGTPVARTDKYLITDADYMIWRPKTNRFSAFGLYQMIQ